MKRIVKEFIQDNTITIRTQTREDLLELKDFLYQLKNYDETILIFSYFLMMIINI